MVEWKEVPSQPGYLACSDGRIAKVMKGTIANTGYHVVKAHSRPDSAHRLVAEAFHGPAPFKKAQVRHLNGIKRDNRANNLAWGTNTDNQIDRLAHGTSNRGSRHGNSTLVENQVREIRRMCATGAYSHQVIADAYGVHRVTISVIARGKTWAWLKEA